MKISVILCTRNPRPAALNPTLDGLRAQTLALAAWELVVVDNGSTQNIPSSAALAWHPQAQLLQEQRPGLAHARAAGLHASRAGLIVFCDDDNVLASDYLERCLEIAASHLNLGAWGGAIDGVFEIPPPAHLERHVHWLALVKIEHARWSNFWGNYETFPAGAGLCIRRESALAYAAKIAEPIHAAFDPPDRRRGCGSDVDMVLSTLSGGLGCGIFPQLRLQHLIPKERLTTEYFEILREGAGYSETMLRHLYDPNFQLNPPPPRIVHRLLDAYHYYRLPAHDKRLVDAYERGRRRALGELGTQ